MAKRTEEGRLSPRTTARKPASGAISARDADRLLDTARARPKKQQITLRVDTDVIAWFKANHPRYQTLMNGVLRKEMTEAIFEEERGKAG